jgi:hypothetical protein
LVVAVVAVKIPVPVVAAEVEPTFPIYLSRPVNSFISTLALAGQVETTQLGSLELQFHTTDYPVMPPP